jgi:hypothetical protein
VGARRSEGRSGRGSGSERAVTKPAGPSQPVANWSLLCRLSICCPFMSNTNEPRAGPKSAGGAFDRKLTELSAGALQQPDNRAGKHGQQQRGGQRGGGSKGGAQSPRGRSAEEEGRKEQRWAAPSSDRPVLPALSSEVAGVACAQQRQGSGSKPGKPVLFLCIYL